MNEGHVCHCESSMRCRPAGAEGRGRGGERRCPPPLYDSFTLSNTQTDINYEARGTLRPLITTMMDGLLNRPIGHEPYGAQVNFPRG